MGIHRINTFEVEEFNSAGDLRLRIETDIRLPRVSRARGFHRRLRNALESSDHETLRDLLLERLENPLHRRGDGRSELTRVRRLVRGALSAPGKPLPRGAT
jgi:hypothetical protein